ncbi:MAG: nuclear transport factor 2 family protein [Candidatus Angelobacter sp.]
MPRFAKAENRQLSSLCSIVSFVVGIGLLIAGCAGEQKHATWTNATGAEQNERLMWQAIQDEDWVNVERHLSPTFIGVTTNGRMFDRAGWVEQWQVAEVQEFSLGDMQIQPEGADMKVTYILHVKASATALLPSSGLRVISIWQEVKTRWMLTAMSITAIQSQ